MERGQGRTGIPHQGGAKLHDIGDIAACFCKDNAVIGRIRLRQSRELVACCPVKFTAVYNNAAHHGTVTADELGCRVYHNICTVFQRTEQERCCESVVHDQRQTVLVSDLCNCFHVYHVRIRVAQRFHIHCLGVRANGCFDICRIVCIYESGFDTDLCVSVCEQVIGAAVNRLRRNDMVAAACDIANGIVNCCGTGCGCQCSCTVFQCGDTLFKNVVGRVHQTGVDVARFCQTETASCLCGILEHIRSGRIDRHCSCISGRVRLFLTDMYLFGFKTIFLICHGESFLSISSVPCGHSENTASRLCAKPSDGLYAVFLSVWFPLLWLYYITIRL